MDGKRWWIIEEIARWWREADETARFMLMQRGLEGTPEATVEEIREGAILAETEQADDTTREIIEAWSAGKGLRRR